MEQTLGKRIVLSRKRMHMTQDQLAEKLGVSVINTFSGCPGGGPEDKTPNWEKITSSELDWRTPQGYVGDEDWAKRTAEHFEIAFPEEEYKADDSEKNKEA